MIVHAKSIARDSSMGLVFLHLQAPHGPHAYDRRKHEFSLHSAPISGYLDSLDLADVILDLSEKRCRRTIRGNPLRFL
jgi:hypothetical protein